MPTLEEIQVYLNENKDQEEIKNYLTGLRTPTVDDFKAAAENNEDVKKFLQSHADQRVTGAIKTYEEKTLPQKLADAEEALRKQLNPQETEDQKRFRELEEKFKNSEARATTAALKTLTLSNLAAEGLSSELADYAMGTDEENTKQRVATLKKIITGEVEKKITETLGGVPTPPKAGAGLPPADISKMSMEEYAKYRTGKY